MTDYSKKRKPLHRFSLEGFKSFKKVSRVKLSLELNVLIGANGSGKTNLVSFFDMLGHMMNPNLGVQNHVASQAGGAEAFLFRGSAVTPEFKASLDFGLNSYDFAMKASDDETLFFSSEEASFDGPMYGKSVYNKGNGHRESKLRDNASTKGEEFTLAALKDWRVYHFHNTSSKAPVMLSTNAVSDTHLHGDAGNIADVLLTMRDHACDYYNRIVQHIQQVAPFFGEFVLKPDRHEQVRLLWKEKGNETIYFPSQLSDGTIRFICLATLLLQPEPPSTIIIDEPELGLHPHAIMVLAGMLRLAEQKCQLIVSTQSSALIDYLEIDELLIVDRKDGASVITQPEEEEFKSWLEDYSLSEVWNKNLMGGRPE